MTVKEGMAEIWRVHGSVLPSGLSAELADRLTGTTWSQAVIKPGREKEWIRLMCRVVTGKMRTRQWKQMEQLMDRPNVN